MRTKAELSKVPFEERQLPVFNPPLTPSALQYLAEIDSDLEHEYKPGGSVLSSMPTELWRDMVSIQQIMNYYREKGGWQVTTWDDQALAYCLKFS